MHSKAKNFPLPISNGILESHHRKAIGPSLWLFLWLIDKCTREEQGQDGQWLGHVLGGKRMTAQDIAGEFGESERSVRRHLKRLEHGGYILILSRTGEASAYGIRKSKKFHKARPFIVATESTDVAGSIPQEQQTPRPKVAAPPATPGRTPGQKWPRNKEDITVTRHRPTATVPEELASGLRAIEPGLDEDAVRKIWERCRAKRADCTVDDILYFAQTKSHLLPKVDNPPGFLIHSLPLCFEGRPPGVHRAAARRFSVTPNVEADIEIDNRARIEIQQMTDGERVALRARAEQDLFQQHPEARTWADVEQLVQAFTLRLHRAAMEKRPAATAKQDGRDQAALLELG